MRIAAQKLEWLIGLQNIFSGKEASDLLNVGLTAVQNVIKGGAIKYLCFTEKGPWECDLNKLKNLPKGQYEKICYKTR